MKASRNNPMKYTPLAQRPTPELNVATAHFSNEIKRRVPWILFSVVAGIMMIWIGQTYENVLAQKIQLVFFIPMIIYMSDSIGTETLALFVRELALRRLSLKHIFLKEILVGLFLGIASGIPMGLFSYLWFKDLALSITVAAAMIINGIIAVFIGMVLPISFAKFGRDPAVGTDEMTTALSDNLSMLVYFIVATFILFGING
jgi:magnesium transporter